VNRLSLAAIGLIIPPVGTVLNVAAGIGRIKMDDVTRGVLACSPNSPSCS
jgi:TRAP-type C4-dicarboxylate transport system permease large subunit